MNVVYGANDGYARHLGVSLYSLLDHNRLMDQLRVFVLSMGISQCSQASLRQIAGQFGRELHFLEMGDLKARFCGGLSTGGYDPSIMLRLFLGECLPQDVKQVIYLDCDTVVAQSLGRLWSARLNGRILGAVQEPTIYPAVKESIGLGAGDPYFNSGVLLVDVERWRREGVQERLLDFYQERKGLLFASDQDVINGGLKGRILSLSPCFNFFPNYRYFSYGTLVRHSPSYGTVGKKEFYQARRRPFVIHYMGDERPWIAGNWNHYRKIYHWYLERTPWAGTPDEKGKRLYMAAYHLMDYTTAVCPAIRWELSRRWGMKLVEKRGNV